MVEGPTQSKEEKFGINVSGTFYVHAASVGLDRSGLVRFKGHTSAPAMTGYDRLDQSHSRTKNT